MMPTAVSATVDSADIDAAVRQVIGGAVDADEVIDLFAVAGLEEARLDILSDEFLGRVAALEQKNLALETLRKLLNDQIRITERTNIVQSGRNSARRLKTPCSRGHSVSLAQTSPEQR